MGYQFGYYVNWLRTIRMLTIAVRYRGQSDDFRHLGPVLATLSINAELDLIDYPD